MLSLYWCRSTRSTVLSPLYSIYLWSERTPSEYNSMNYSGIRYIERHQIQEQRPYTDASVAYISNTLTQSTVTEEYVCREDSSLYGLFGRCYVKVVNQNCYHKPSSTTISQMDAIYTKIFEIVKYTMPYICTGYLFCIRSNNCWTYVSAVISEGWHINIFYIIFKINNSVSKHMGHMWYDTTHYGRVVSIQKKVEINSATS